MSEEILTQEIRVSRFVRRKSKRAMFPDDAADFAWALVSLLEKDDLNLIVLNFKEVISVNSAFLAPLITRMVKREPDEQERKKWVQRLSFTNLPNEIALTIISESLRLASDDAYRRLVKEAWDEELGEG